MNMQITQSKFLTPTPKFFVLVFLCLFATAVAGQEPMKDETSEAIAGKSRPKIVNPVAPVVADMDPVTALRQAKSIYVMSSSLLVGASVVEDKLQKREEFARLGLVITRDYHSADLILQLDHDVFTKYVYTAVDARSNIVVASGKLSSLGGTVAGKVAKRFLKQLAQARSSAPQK
jgi:hypothetical protein